jgi:3-methyladenine DNA glycosylase AlkC
LPNIDDIVTKQKSTNFSLKDHLFNAERVGCLAQQFSAAVPGFDDKSFTRAVMKQLKPLELKQRIVLIAETLEYHLADDFPTAARQVLSALPPELDPAKTDDDFGDFIIAPLGEFVVRRGMAKEHVAISLKTLKEITKRFSMEDALRSFLNTHPKKTLGELSKWSTDPNYHVRRLVSEGTRPRLPWSVRLSIHYTIPMPLLDQLHADRTRYVTRSVANHLNDIAKLDPELVLKTLGRWRKESKQQSEELDWICRHALRTLIKQGHPETMELLGYRTDPHVTVSAIKIANPSISAGESLDFSFAVTALRNESLIVDYRIDFVKANGSLSPKVFKAKKLELQRGESITITKRHPLRADATTYRLFPGTHRLTIQINGIATSSICFEIR